MRKDDEELFDRALDEKII